MNMKSAFLTTAAAGLMALTATTAAHAAPLLADNFDSYAQGLDATSLGSKWIVTNTGDVDVIGTGFYDFFPGNGNYIDLGGSNGTFGQFSSTQSFAPGTYTLSFALGGTSRGDNDTTTITLGDWSTSIALLSGASLANHSYTFTTTGGQLSFLDTGANGNVGNILDNVALTAVPEPATWAMMLLGFGMVGFALRKRNVRTTVRYA